MARFLRGFVWAARGIAGAVREEQNFRFHLCAAAYVVFFAQFYALARTEQLLLVVLIAGVLSLELVNSAVERVVDKASPEKNPLAGMAKDLAAGGVLVFSIGAAVCGVWLFWDTAVFATIAAWFTGAPLRLVLLAASLAASVCFVFIPGRKKRNKD